MRALTICRYRVTGKEFVIEATFVKLNPSRANETFEKSTAIGSRAHLKSDGEHILLFKEQYGAINIYEVDFLGGNEKKLTTFQSKIYLLNIVPSPSGNQFFAIGGTLEENREYNALFFANSPNDVEKMNLVFPD